MNVLKAIVIWSWNIQFCDFCIYSSKLVKNWHFHTIHILSLTKHNVDLFKSGVYCMVDHFKIIFPLICPCFFIFKQTCLNNWIIYHLTFIYTTLSNGHSVLEKSLLSFLSLATLPIWNQMLNSSAGVRTLPAVLSMFSCLCLSY